MKEDLISVIVPVYNVKKYLQECLNSIINQTYRNLEIILIDDGSNDGSEKICDEYLNKDNRIKVIHNSNVGLSGARNAGIEKAHGRFIQFIDSDDYIDTDTIEIIHDLAIGHNADIVCFSHYILNNENLYCEYDSTTKELTSMEAIKKVILDDKIRNYTWEKLWKRELFNNIRFPVGRKFEDILTTPLLMEKADKILLYDVPKYYYRQRKDSIMGQQSKSLRVQYIESVFEINEYLLKHYPQLEKFINYSIVNMALNTYNDIGVFGMYELLEENIVKQIYNKARIIFKDENSKKLIREQSSNIKYMHIELLMKDIEGYYKQHCELPVIYPEHIGIEKSRKNEAKEDSNVFDSWTRQS